jgi:hypothetical protein
MYSAEGAGYFYNMLTTLFDANGVSPNYVQHVTQIHSMLALVHAGLGAALVPEAAMSLHFDDVQFRPVATTPDRPVELYMAWRKDNDSPILQARSSTCAWPRPRRRRGDDHFIRFPRCRGPQPRLGMTRLLTAPKPRHGVRSGSRPSPRSDFGWERPP